jgi:hypothetical protein
MLYVCVAFAVSKRKKQSFMFESALQTQKDDYTRRSARLLVCKTSMVAGNGFLVQKASKYAQCLFCLRVSENSKEMIYV